MENKKDFFSHGKGLPFELHPQKKGPKNDEERQKPVLIDLDDLEKPGRSPMNYRPSNR